MRRWTFGILTLGLLVPTLSDSALKLESLSGLSVLIDVYVYQPGNFQLKPVARTSILESMELFKPESDNWFVRPYKNPAGPYTQPEYRGIVSWVDKERVVGLVLDGHPELGDEDIARLRGLQKLTLLSLRGTGISDRSMNTLGHMKNLRYLDISDTAVTGRGLAAIKSLKLVKLASEKTQIDPEELKAFLAAKKNSVAVLPPEWSSVWDAARNPEPLAEPLNFFAGSTPDEGIPGYLPKGKFKFNYNFPLQTLDGRSGNLSSQKGRVIFMNIWSTDCVPCRSELPGLESLYKTIKDDRFFMAYVTAQPASQVQDSVLQQPRKLPIYTTDKTAITPYTNAGLPVTVIVSKKGEWVVHKNGAERWDTNAIISFINKLLQAPDK